MARIPVTIPISLGIHNKGNCYFASNMRKDPTGGMLADYSLSNLQTATSGAVSEWIKRITQWVQREYSSDITIFGRTETNGDIYALDELGTLAFRAMDYSQTFGSARGLAIDSNNELVYSGARYLGRTITTTLNGSVSAGATTIDVTDATGAPTSGYAFIKDGIGNSETIQYTGITGNQLTGVTKGKFNSTDRAHATALEIIFFDDDWKDLGAQDLVDERPVFRSEDWILAGNGNTVAGYSETDGSDYSANLLDLPSEYKIVDFSEILTGGGLKVLIAANKENRGAIFVWNKADSTWERKIPVNENIKKLNGTIVGLETGVYETDGYGLKLIAPLPDDDGDVRGADFNIYDIKRKETILLVTANCGKYHRNRTGLWILDMKTGEWFYVQPSNGGAHGILFGAILISSSWRILVSTSFNNGAIDQLFTSSASRGNYYQIIHDPKSGREQKLSSIKLSLFTKLKTDFNNSNLNFEVIVRYYDFKSPFLQYTQLAAASSAADEMIISSSLGIPNEGDRIEIIERSSSTHVNVAGAIRNVLSVEDDGSNKKVTLDEDLPATIDATTAAANLDVIINPLKKITSISVTGSSIDLKDLEISVKDQPEYKKLMIEVEIRYGGSTYLPVGLNAIEIVSDVEE